jgi:hypothetical protein
MVVLIRTVSSGMLTARGGPYTWFLAYPRRKISQGFASGERGGKLLKPWQSFRITLYLANNLFITNPIHIWSSNIIHWVVLIVENLYKFTCGRLHITWQQRAKFWCINPLKPNDHFSGSISPLTSKRYILYIYSTNKSTEYFKHGIYSPFFPFQIAVCFS